MEAQHAVRIDSHQHFWRYSPAQHGWIDDRMGAIRRDFGPEHLGPLLAECGIGGCITVQVDQTLDETRSMLDTADAHPFVVGVVGWVDLRSPAVGEQLRAFASHPRFVGVRHIVQGEPDPRFVLQDDFQRGVRTLQEFDLVYDVLVYPHQLAAAVELAERHPQQSFVLDHLAKPRIATGERTTWARDLASFARLPNTSCKVSGMVTEADWTHWRGSDLQPYFRTALESFGPRRLMYGSDWPVCLVASGYRRWFDLVQSWLTDLPALDREQVLGGTAARVYGIADSPKMRNGS